MNFPWFWFFFTSTCFVCNTNFCMLVDTGNIDISNSKTHLKASDFNIKTPFIDSNTWTLVGFSKYPLPRNWTTFQECLSLLNFPFGSAGSEALPSTCYPLFWTYPHSYSSLHIWLIQTSSLDPFSPISSSKAIHSFELIHILIHIYTFDSFKHNP